MGCGSSMPLQHALNCVPYFLSGSRCLNLICFSAMLLLIFAEPPKPCQQDDSDKPVLVDHPFRSIASIIESCIAKELMLWRQKAVEHMFHYSGTGFHVVPKFHLFQHMPLHITRAGVPRTYWVYSDETKNRQVKGLWTKVSKGWSMHEQIFLRLMWLEALENL